MKTRLGACLAMIFISLNAIGAEFCWEAEGCSRFTGVGLAAMNPAFSTGCAPAGPALS